MLFPNQSKKIQKTLIFPIMKNMFSIYLTVQIRWVSTLSVHTEKCRRLLLKSWQVAVETIESFQKKNGWSVTQPLLARNFIFKPRELVCFQNRKLATFDELPKWKREEDGTSLLLYVQYMTPVVPNYKGFERSFPVSENQLHENHENRPQNRCFPVGGQF